MSTQAITGQGTKFKIGISDIAEINSISGPTMSRETIDVTVLSDTDGYRKFIPGLRDPGTISLDMNFTEAGWKEMKDLFESDEESAFSIELPPGANSTTISFSGFVTECPIEIPIGDKITASVTIQISGEVEYDGVGDTT